jgi:choline dehydrogenase-like flavoprotein
MANGRAEIVIGGGGAAGCVLARRLADLRVDPAARSRARPARRFTRGAALARPGGGNDLLARAASFRPAPIGRRTDDRRLAGAQHPDVGIGREMGGVSGESLPGFVQRASP